jgi:hypothetical protein
VYYRSAKNGEVSGKDQYVVSRYIDHPLLVGGRKFDLRYPIFQSPL